MGADFGRASGDPSLGTSGRGSPLALTASYLKAGLKSEGGGSPKVRPESGLPRLGVGPEHRSGRLRLNGVRARRLHRCSSQSELREADSGQFTRDPPSGPPDLFLCLPRAVCAVLSVILPHLC